MLRLCRMVRLTAIDKNGNFVTSIFGFLLDALHAVEL